MANAGAGIQPLNTAAEAAAKAAEALESVERHFDYDVAREIKEFEAATDRVIVDGELPGPLARLFDVSGKAHRKHHEAHVSWKNWTWRERLALAQLGTAAAEADLAYWEAVAEALATGPQFLNCPTFGHWQKAYNAHEQEAAKAERAEALARAKQTLSDAATALTQAAKFYGAQPAPREPPKNPDGTTDYSFAERVPDVEHPPVRASYLVNGVPSELRNGKFEPVQMESGTLALPRPLPSGR